MLRPVDVGPVSPRTLEMMPSSVFRCARLLIVCAFVAACGDPGSPDNAVTGPLKIALSAPPSGTVSDTIEAMLAAQLIATVTDASDRVVPDTAVQFLANGGVFFGTFPNATIRPITVKTDAEGKARVYMQLDTVAGHFRAKAQVLGTTAIDSVPVTVLPGAPASLVMAPRDSVLYVNNTSVLRVARLDRRKNSRTELPDFAIRTSGVVTLADSTITGTAFGRTIIEAEMAGLKDSVVVSVIPTATIVATGAPTANSIDAAFHVFNLDGSGHSIIPNLTSTQYVQSLRFEPAGDKLLYADDVGSGVHLFSVSPSGGPPTQLTTDATAFDTTESQPQMTRDGTAIYFTKGVHNTLSVWSASSTGTNPSRLTPMGAAWEEYYPTPSPDGSRLAFIWDQGFGPRLMMIRTVATGAVDTTTVQGDALRWAPAGNEIAMVVGGQLEVYDAGTRSVTILDKDNSHHFGRPYIEWSPDGAWLLSCAANPTQLVLVRRSPVTVIPLAWTRTYNLCSAAWKP